MKPALIARDFSALLYDRLVYKALRSCRVSPLLKELRWLPIERRIEEKILTMTLKARNGAAPSYLTELLRDSTPVRFEIVRLPYLGCTNFLN